MSNPKIQKAKEWIKNAPTVIFFLGAGVSTGSGLPTFRGLFGLYNWPFICFCGFSILSFFASYWNFWSSFVLFIFGVISCGFVYLCTFVVLTEIGWRKFNLCAWIIFKICFYDLILSKEPSKSHRLIKRFSKKNVVILTTNVDGLEGEDKNVHRLHGYFREFICTKCGSVVKFKGDKKLSWTPKQCCGVYMRTKCSLWGDENIPNKYINWTLFESCPVTTLKKNDVFIIDGSSATYSNNYFEMAFNSKCKVIEINVNDSSVFDNRGQLYLKGTSDDILKKLIN